MCKVLVCCTFSEGSGNGGFFPHTKCGVSRVPLFALVFRFPAEKILQNYNFDISSILACDSSDLFSLTYFFLILQRLASLVRPLWSIIFCHLLL